MAGEEYRRIVSEEPASPLADDALYKLAYVYAEELDQPAVALVQYRALADSYPDSPWVDDALMRIMQIQRQTLRDPAAVRATWEELCRRFGDRKALCARGLLELARAHFDAEDYASVSATADELMAQYAEQQTQCAQAALLQARASERMGLDQAEVEKLYEAVIDRFPDTHAAAMAKRNIGWMYYGRREELEQRQAEEIRARSRVIQGVPAHSAPDNQLLQALSALRAALAYRGEQRSLEWLAAVTEAPFVILFDANRPAAGPAVPGRSPFETVADSLGFAHNTVSGASAEHAFETLHQALLQGHPVIVRYGSPAHWIIVTGYDLKDQRVYFMPPGRDRYAASSREQFLANWRAASSGGSGLAGPEPFHQFSLGARLSRPSEGDLLRIIAERAADGMKRNTLAGAPAGTAAWEAAGAWLERCVAPEEADLRQTAVGWVEGSLRSHLTMAETVTPILQRAEAEIPALQGAAARHTELREEAELVARKVEEATAAGEEASTKWQAAAAQASYVSALHRRLAEQFIAATDGG